MDKSLAHGSIELYLRYHNLTAIGWGEFEPFSDFPCLLRVDLSGMPKLESIPKLVFGNCSHLVTVVFGEYSNITNLGRGAFQYCSALTNIILPISSKSVKMWCWQLHVPRTRRLQQKTQNFWRCHIPRLLQARRCPACIQLDLIGAGPSLGVDLLSSPLLREL